MHIIILDNHYKYTYDGSRCVTEYVCGICVDLCPGYLYDWRSLAEVESIKPVTCRVRVYKREIQRLLTEHIFTSTHAMTVVV